jgi:hypothetical protein
MKPMRSRASFCSHCRHYTPEGRRGGQCGLLNVPVKGRWQSCSMAMPVFKTPLPVLEVFEKIPQPIEVRMPEVLMETPEPLKARL